MKHLLVALTLLGNTGCVTGYLWLDSPSFRDQCEAGDTCKKAIAIEATAWAGTAFIVTGAALIAKAMNDDGTQELSLEEQEVVEEKLDPPAPRAAEEDYPGF